jgi:hypothetical protein
VARTDVVRAGKANRLWQVANASVKVTDSRYPDHSRIKFWGREELLEGWKTSVQAKFDLMRSDAPLSRTDVAGSVVIGTPGMGTYTTGKAFAREFLAAAPDGVLDPELVPSYARIAMSLDCFGAQFDQYYPPQIRSRSIMLHLLISMMLHSFPRYAYEDIKRHGFYSEYLRLLDEVDIREFLLSLSRMLLSRGKCRASQPWAALYIHLDAFYHFGTEEEQKGLLEEFIALVTTPASGESPARHARILPIFVFTGTYSKILLHEPTQARLGFLPVKFPWAALQPVSTRVAARLLAGYWKYPSPERQLLWLTDLIKTADKDPTFLRLTAEMGGAFRHYSLTDLHLLMDGLSESVYQSLMESPESARKELARTIVEWSELTWPSDAAVEEAVKSNKVLSIKQMLVVAQWLKQPKTERDARLKLECIYRFRRDATNKVWSPQEFSMWFETSSEESAERFAETYVYAMSGALFKLSAKLHSATEKVPTAWYTFLRSEIIPVLPKSSKSPVLSVDERGYALRIPCILLDGWVRRTSRWLRERVEHLYPQDWLPTEMTVKDQLARSFALHIACRHYLMGRFRARKSFFLCGSEDAMFPHTQWIHNEQEFVEEHVAPCLGKVGWDEKLSTTQYTLLESVCSDTGPIQMCSQKQTLFQCRSVLKSVSADGQEAGERVLVLYQIVGSQDGMLEDAVALAACGQEALDPECSQRLSLDDGRDKILIVLVCRHVLSARDMDDLKQAVCASLVEKGSRIGVVLIGRDEIEACMPTLGHRFVNDFDALTV